MSKKQPRTPTLMTTLVFPVALVVIVGIFQILFALGVLVGGLSSHWFLPITLVGIFFSMAVIVYTTINSLNKAHVLRKSAT